MKENWQTYFSGKKITLMGLGLLGRGINVAKFLLENGAQLTITDLKPKERLLSSLAELAVYEKQITYVLGEHRLEDFRNCDLVIKTAGVPLESPLIEEAHKYGVPVEMDASLFAKLAPDGVTIVGITGTRGKSTTTHLIHYILEKSGKRVFLGGNVRGLATLPLLPGVKSGDMVVLELDSWQLQGFGEAKISPHIAVFTNLLSDHMNYYKGDVQKYFADKANIFLWQKEGDFLIAGEAIGQKIEKDYGGKFKGKLIMTGISSLPTGWKLLIPGEHNRLNAAFAFAATSVLGLPDEEIKKAMESFPGVEGRLQLVGEKNGFKLYNDNNATTADATVAGLSAVASGRNVVLIVGGADKGLDMSNLVSSIGEHCKAVVLLSGTGTEKIKDEIKAIPGIKVEEKERLEECFAAAISLAKKGDVVLFSPAFASFSPYFQNEYERNDLFMKEVKQWLAS